MNENINLCEILKGHEGETFYCVTVGEVELIGVDDNNPFPIKIRSTNVPDYTCYLISSGKACELGERIFFPSKDQRDWNKWDKENNHRVPKTWSEYINQFNIDSEPTLWFDNDMNWDVIGNSCSALFKIHQLIEVGYGGNVTNEEWKDRSITKWRIGFDYDGETMIDYCVSPIAYTPIAFHTKEQAKEFLKYSENIDLLNDYFMIISIK